MAASLGTAQTNLDSAESYKEELEHQVLKGESDESLMEERLERAGKSLKKVKLAAHKKPQEDASCDIDVNSFALKWQVL